MKLILTPQEIISFPSIIPEEGKLVDQIAYKAMIDKVEFTEEEKTRIGLSFGSFRGQSITSMDSKKAEGFEKEIEFSLSKSGLLKKAVDLLDKHGKVALHQISLCEKIINSED